MYRPTCIFWTNLTPSRYSVAVYRAATAVAADLCVGDVRVCTVHWCAHLTYATGLQRANLYSEWGVANAQDGIDPFWTHSVAGTCGPRAPATRLEASVCAGTTVPGTSRRGRRNGRVIKPQQPQSFLIQSCMRRESLWRQSMAAWNSSTELPPGTFAQAANSSSPAWLASAPRASPRRNGLARPCQPAPTRARPFPVEEFST
jgi:hypothetical protein